MANDIRCNELKFGTSDNASKCLLDAGIYLLMEEIDAASCKAAITFILEKNIETNGKRLKEIKMIICSPGGDVSGCFALTDVMMASKIPVMTFGIGQICSCGLLIFMAGKKRILTPNTSILSHQYSWGDWGKEHELLATRKEQDLTSRKILTHYQKCTKLPAKTIKEKLLCPSDTWLTADEALKYNLCDEIREFSV